MDGSSDNRTDGMTTWRAGCGGTRTSGSEGGPQKSPRRKAGKALRPDPYTEHPTNEGKLSCAAVLDAYSRMIIGWSIAGHIRTELVTDALGMAPMRGKPTKDETILHSAHGTQDTSWAFGQRLRNANLLGSMGTVGDCSDNSMMESFWAPCNSKYSTSRPGKLEPSLPTRYSNG